MRSNGIKILTKYEKQYWETMIYGREFLPENILPDFLADVKQVNIYHCTDGYLILRYAQQEGMEFIVTGNSPTTWKELLHEQKLYDQHGKESTRRFTIQAKDPTKLRGHYITIGGFMLRKQSFLLRPLFLSATIVFDEPDTNFRDGAKTAKDDIRTILSASNLGVPVVKNVDDTRDRVIKKLYSLSAKYRQCLATAEREEDLQIYLRDNRFILNPWGKIYPKYKLGKEYITDFLIEDRLAPDFSYVFVEIEPASTTLFRKAKREQREFRARVQHGLNQLTDWEIWIRDNSDQLKRDFPDFDLPRFELIIGRDSSLSQKQKRVIRNANAAVKNRTILTYDDLANRLEGLIDSLKELTLDST